MLWSTLEITENEKYAFCISDGPLNMQIGTNVHYASRDNELKQRNTDFTEESFSLAVLQSIQHVCIANVI